MYLCGWVTVWLIAQCDTNTNCILPIIIVPSIPSFYINTSHIYIVVRRFYRINILIVRIYITWTIHRNVHCTSRISIQCISELDDEDACHNVAYVKMAGCLSWKCENYPTVMQTQKKNHKSVNVAFVYFIYIFFLNARDSDYIAHQRHEKPFCWQL